MVKKAAQARPNHLLRTARKERGWTQQDVADRIGAPLSLNVTRWEGGTAFPSAHYIEKLCLVFGKPAKELGLIQEEYSEIFEPTNDASDAGNSQGQSPSSPQTTHHLIFVPRSILFIGLALLVAIASGGLLYFNWSTTHRPPPPRRVVSPVDMEATVRGAATATIVATYPNPYPPHNGKLTFYDPLSEPYLWRNDANNSLGSKCQFTKDAYHVSSSKMGTAATCFNPDFDKDDFTIEVQMKIVQGDCGGIVLHSNEPEDYQFAVCQDGYYSFTRYQNYTSWKELVDKASPAISIGLNQVNIIAVVANKSTFDLYVNKQKVNTVHDSAYSHGQIALVAFSNIVDITEVIYSHAKVWIA